MSNDNTQKTIPSSIYDEQDCCLINKITVSVVILTYNSADSIEWTLESLSIQKEASFEIIIIDAGSEDHTLDIAQAYGDLITRVYSVAEYNRCDMFNRGITLASGDYITFLEVGAFYQFDRAFAVLSKVIEKESKPDLIYFGAVLLGSRTSRFLFETSFVENLKKGADQIRLESCWFKFDLFEKIGKFDPFFSEKFGLEFFARLQQHQSSIVGYERFFLITNHIKFFSIKVFYETWYMLKRYFGIITAIKWVLGIDHLKLVGLFLKRFWKKN